MPGSTGSTRPTRKPGPIIEAACWAHGRRKFFELARAAEGADRDRGGRAHRCAVRDRARDQRPRARTAPRGAQRAQPRRSSPISRAGCASSAPSSPPGARLAKAIDYSLKRWTALTRFLDDGRICLSNNAAERAVRGIALGRKNWTFAGSDRGGQRAAAIYTLIETALCRARHKAVYAARRTMPNGLVFPRIPRDRHVIGSA